MITRVEAALSSLERLMGGARAACDELSELSFRADLMSQFEELYPQRFALSAPDCLAQGFHEAARAYLAGLAEQFPLQDYWLDELLEDLDESSAFLYIVPQGLSVEEREAEDFRLLFRVIFLATGAYAGLDDPLSRTYPPVGIPDPERLTESCSGARRPLSYLPEAYRYACGSTGNIWLDESWDLFEGGVEYPRWTRENITWLTLEWNEAKPVLERIQRLTDWLEKKPERRGRQVYRLLKEAAEGPEAGSEKRLSQRPAEFQEEA
jgi:hypothetical protein